MSEGSWPSPNHGTPARSVTDAEYQHLAPWHSDGLFPAASPAIYANSSGMEIHVRAGQYGLVRGHAWASGTTEVNLSIGNNTSGQTRIDTAVLRLDRSTWDVRAAVRAGTPGAGAPALVRDSGDTGLFEVPIADITVATGTASIAAGAVKYRPLLQAAGVRACTLITDIQAVLVAGDMVYETQTGRWIAWTGTAGVVLYQDTGWATFTPKSGFYAGAFAMRVRNRNGVAYLKGNCLRDGTVSIQSSSTPSVAQLPNGFAPNEDHVWLAPIGQSAAGRMRLQPSGLITITAMPVGNLTEGQGVYLDTTYLLG